MRKRTLMARTMLMVVSAIFLVTSLIYAGNDPQIYTRFGPATSTSQVTISAVSGKRNCLSNVDVISDSAYTFRVLDGGTTVYALSLAANTGMVRSWNLDDSVCGTSNTAMILKVSAGTYNINYTGYSH